MPPRKSLIRLEVDEFSNGPAWWLRDVYDAITDFWRVIRTKQLRDNTGDDKIHLISYFVTYITAEVMYLVWYWRMWKGCFQRTEVHQNIPR